MSQAWSYSEIPDWARLRGRCQSFLAGTFPDGGVIAHVQNPHPTPAASEPWMREGGETKYLDPDRLAALKEWQRSTWERHGDLFAYETASYGPNVFAGFCGAEVTFGPDTVWNGPAIASVEEADAIHFDNDGYLWRRHLETTDAFIERYRGVKHLGLTDFGGPADWLSSVLPTEAFLLALVEAPDQMRDFGLRLARECNRAYDAVYERIAPHNDGVVNWMPVWGPGRVGTLQDDVAINVSAAMYADIFLPALRELAKPFDTTVLHWHDGCAQHLDTLLQLPEIDVVQYGHDPSSPPFRDGLANMRKIQAAGKRLFISCVAAEDAKFFIDNLDPCGLLMIVDAATSDASRRLVDDIAIWSSARLAGLP